MYRLRHFHKPTLNPLPLHPLFKRPDVLATVTITAIIVIIIITIAHCRRFFYTVCIYAFSALFFFSISRCHKIELQSFSGTAGEWKRSDIIGRLWQRNDRFCVFSATERARIPNHLLSGRILSPSLRRGGAHATRTVTYDRISSRGWVFKNYNEGSHRG